MFNGNPEAVISQVVINSLRRVSFQQINRRRRTRRLLHQVDFDTFPLEYISCPGVERLHSVVKYTPHNFPSVAYLDLAETYYTRVPVEMMVRDPPKFSPPQNRIMFEDMTVRFVATAILRHIRHHPTQIHMLLRIFMGYALRTRCIEDGELINVTNFCLRALHHQFHPDGELVVDVLQTFCRTRLHKVAVVSGADYSHRCIEYVAESCRRIGYDLQYFFRHSLRGRILGFCAVRTCVLSAEANLRRMNIFLQYGFEPLELNGASRTAIYLGLRLARHMRSKGINPINPPHLHRYYTSCRRSDFIMEFFYMVIGSLGAKPRVWVKCSKLFFNAILDPFICKGEMLALLESLCHSVDHPIIMQALDTFFYEVFDEKPMPRSLKHQARCHVRRLLGNNYQLPYGVCQLDIPHTLHFYLRLDD